MKQATGDSPVGKCHLCGNMRELKNSHVWPQLAYWRYVSDQSKGGRFADLFTMTLHGRQYKRPWLCCCCEQRLSDSERPIASLLDRLETDPHADQAYDEHLLRFATSVSWRTLKLFYDNMDNAAIESIWKAAKYWKHYLRGSRPGINPYTQHIYVINDNPHGFNKMVGGHVFEAQSLVFSQIGPLLIVGHMKPETLLTGDRAIWRRSQLSSSGGMLVPLRKWITGPEYSENQNITLPFAALLGLHQAEILKKVASRDWSGKPKRSRS